MLGWLGGGQVVERSSDSGAIVAAAEDKKSIWNRLKSSWWPRGILSAIALVGLMDHLGFVREEWLSVLHAFGARWNQWIEFLTELINFRVDWIHVSVGEGNLLTIFWILGWPALSSLVHAVNEAVPKSVGRLAFRIFATGVGVAILAALFAPGDVANVSYDSVFGSSILMMYFMAICLLAVLAARTHASYYRAIFSVLTFFATLEVFYLVPIVNDATSPFVEWIDPGESAPIS
jgi:hypothetical protein